MGNVTDRIRAHFVRVVELLELYDAPPHCEANETYYASIGQ